MRPVMTWPIAEREGGSVVEVHGISCEGHDAMGPRLTDVFAASGCCLVRYGRRTRRCVEYSFEIELNRAVDLYCGLVQAGLEMTEISHRLLTELCVLRRHERAWSRPERVVSLRLVISFDRMAETEVREGIAPVCGW